MIAIAIDDEPVALDIIKLHAAKVPFLTLKATFTNAFEAISFLQQEKVDLLFLDIKMPDISGIEFMKSLIDPPMVVFTTAYSEHAVQSFELDAIDYLLKPFSLARLLKACNKANELHQLRNQQQAPQQQHLFIKDGYEQIKVELNSIIYLESAGNYLNVITETQSIITRLTINEMMALLPPNGFIRIHRSYIIACKKVTRFDKQQVWLGNKCIQIGSTYADALLQLN